MPEKFMPGIFMHGIFMNDKRSLLVVLENSEISSGRGIFTCIAGSDFEGFKGHFKNKPVIPGVVQMHWAVESVRIISGDSDFIPKFMTQIKFVNFLTPDTTFTIETKKVNDKWLFSIFNSEMKFASGRLA